jgi:two-component system, cell cycle sensor histidine kinase and response regulator CckA
MIHKQRAWHIQAFLLALLSVFLLAGHFILSTATFLYSLAHFLWHRSVEKQTRIRTRELQEQVDVLRQPEEKKNDTVTQDLQTQEIMAVCSRFAGGLSHDLNNILSGLTTFPEMILMDLPEESPLVKPLNAIMRSGLRVSGVVSQLMTVSKGVSGHSLTVDINKVIEHSLDSEDTQNLSLTHPELEIAPCLDDGLLNAECVPEHLDSIVKNLVKQCCDAMMGQGKISLQTENRYLDTPLELATGTVPPGEYACLVVSDNGSAISTEDMSHIFEPYYCKKVLQRSCSGMGMATVWNLVKDFGGYIEALSLRKGAAYTVYLPATRKKAHDHQHPAPEPLEINGHGESILIIDDDPLQRDVASEILGKAGYTIHTADSGEQAVDFLKTQTVDLLVLDMIMMPGINGYETYKQILRIVPDQRAIIASGYVRSDEMAKVQALGAGIYVRKPYSIGQLLEAVKKELNRS